MLEHIRMTGVDHLDPLQETGLEQPITGRCQGLLLNVKTEDTSLPAHYFSEKHGIVTVAERGVDGNAAGL